MATDSALPAGAFLSTMTGGNTIGSSFREAKPRSDGYRHIDTPGLIAKLQGMHATHYTYGIWDSPTDWDDLRLEFLPAAEKAGIQVLAYLVPPSESQVNGGKASRPYNTDYVAWAQALANLSLQQKALVAWAIDDFSLNQTFFTPDYLTQVTNTYKQINQNLGFFTTAYYGAAIDDAFLDKYGPFVNGFIYPYLGAPGANNTQDVQSLPSNLNAIKAKFDARKLELILLIYTQRFIGAWPLPTESYTAQAIAAGIPYLRDGRIKGIIAYGTQLDDAPTLTSDNKAMYGNGRLSFTVSESASTTAGSYAQATQQVQVDPNAARYELSFWHFDQYVRTPSGVGYHFKQILIDNNVIFDSDVMDTGWHLWMQGTVLQGPIDVTTLLKGKSTATLTLRLLDKKGVGDFPVDAGFDHLQSLGFTIVNPDFETTEGWALSTTHAAMRPALDIWVPDRPKRIYDAVAQGFQAARSGGG